MGTRTLVSALLIGLAAAACTGPREARLTEETEAQVAISEPVRAWEVLEDGLLAGALIEFVERGGERRFFSVRNPHQQELGLVDAHGRSWRYRPHADEPEWLGTGTILEGVRRILGLGPGAALSEVALENWLAAGN